MESYPASDLHYLEQISQTAPTVSSTAMVYLERADPRRYAAGLPARSGQQQQHVRGELINGYRVLQVDDAALALFILPLHIMVCLIASGYMLLQGMRAGSWCTGPLGEPGKAGQGRHHARQGEADRRRQAQISGENY
jgi:hypothetical protein